MVFLPFGLSLGVYPILCFFRFIFVFLPSFLLLFTYRLKGNILFLFIYNITLDATVAGCLLSFAFHFVVPSCLSLYLQACFLFVCLFVCLFLLHTVWCAGLHFFCFLPACSLRLALHGQITLLYLRCVSLSRRLSPQSSSLCIMHQHGHWLCWM